MYQSHNSGNKNSSSSLAIVSSVLFPHHTEGSLIKRRRVNLQCLPGAWIEDKRKDDDNEEEEDEENDEEEEGEDKEQEQDKDNNDNKENVFVKTVSATPPKLPLLDTTNITTSAAASDQDIELLKQTIANLRKEKQKLEETNDIVKKSIQIVARKRLIAQTTSQHKRNKSHNNSSSDNDSTIGTTTDEEEDIYIVVPSDFIPTQDEMKAAGLDGWEWISAY